MTVSVVIINYNTFLLTSNCIRSVIEQTKGVDYEIILVDNASSECDPERFRAEFSSIKLIKSGVNGGFAFGNNLGLNHATGEYILLLNSDTVLQEDTISKTVHFFRQHPDAGMVGCRMIYPGGHIQYSARRFRSISWELLDMFRFIPRLMPYKKRATLMLGKYFRHDENIEADWISGAFLLFRKSVIQSLPGAKLDDRFFMYGEDQLWCEQFKQLGKKIFFYAGTTIEHINSGSTNVSKQLALRKKMTRHELEIMQLRKGKGLYYYIFKIILLFKEGTRNLVKYIYFKLTGKLIR